MQIIESYCGRDMTYESDSLLAIMSALNTCNESAIRHIWGLPYSSKDHRSARIEANHPLQTALLWKHAQPCSRRGALPSWSPMAWTGKITWGGQIFPYSWRIQTIANGTGALQTFGVGSNMIEDLEDQPRLLQITARMSRFRPVRVFQLKEETIQASSQPDDPQGFCLAIPLSKEIDLISQTPCWDVDPSGIDVKKPILGLFFEDMEHLRSSGNPVFSWYNGRAITTNASAFCHSHIRHVTFSSTSHTKRKLFACWIKRREFLGIWRSVTGIDTCIMIIRCTTCTTEPSGKTLLKRRQSRSGKARFHL